MNVEGRAGARLGRRQEAASRTGGAIGVVMSVVQSGAGFFNVRARIRTLATLQEGREGKKYLGECEEENRRSPQGARQHA
jgi:hypothetical protein